VIRLITGLYNGDVLTYKQPEGLSGEEGSEGLSGSDDPPDTPASPPPRMSMSVPVVGQSEKG
jgi:hypothetical protein